jgi:hypothetical protein
MPLRSCEKPWFEAKFSSFEKSLELTQLSKAYGYVAKLFEE